MNVYRLTGDVSHLVALIVLLVKIWRSHSCIGISGKSQVLYALVFTTRYTDLIMYFISFYNTIMKVSFLLLTYATVYSIYGKFKTTYFAKNDSFPVMLLLPAVGILAFVIRYRGTESPAFEFLWTFSICLESVAIMPQLLMIFKMGRTEIITTFYLITLGSYRAWYLVNWVYRYRTEGYFDIVAIAAGIVQTVLYVAFFLAAFLVKVPLYEKVSQDDDENGTQTHESVGGAISDKLPLI